MKEYVPFFIVSILGLIAIFILNTYNKINYRFIKINKADNNIKDALYKKYEILMRMIEYLHKNEKIIEEDFNAFLNTNLKTVNNIILNNTLEDTYKQIKVVLEDNDKLYKDETIKKIMLEIKEVDIVINGCKKYYNNNLNPYNKLLISVPTGLIAKIFKFKKKDFYKEEKQEGLKILKN